LAGIAQYFFEFLPRGDASVYDFSVQNPGEFSCSDFVFDEIKKPQQTSRVDDIYLKGIIKIKVQISQQSSYRLTVGPSGEGLHFLVPILVRCSACCRVGFFHEYLYLVFPHLILPPRGGKGL